MSIDDRHPSATINVPPEAWCEYWRDVEAWRLKLRHRHEQPNDRIDDHLAKAVQP